MHPNQSYPELVDVYGPLQLEGGTLILIKHSPDCLPTKAPYPIKSCSDTTIPSKYISHCVPSCYSPCSSIYGPHSIGVYPPRCVAPCGPIYAKPQCITPYRPLCGIPQCGSPYRPIYTYPLQPQCGYPCGLPLYGRPQCLNPCRPICVNPCQPQCVQPCYPQCGYPRPSICVRPSCQYPCAPLCGYPCSSQVGQLYPCDYFDIYYLE